MRRNQKGMVSIIVTMIILVVLSLIVIGFAQISRREQRQSLDRQLSTQAYYAAESGINLARDKILAGFNGDFPSCNDAKSTWTGETALSTESNSDIPCLLVDQTLQSLEFSSVGPEATVVPLESESDTFSELTFSWQAKEGSAPTNFACGNAAKQFVANGSWGCDTGVLRVDLIPVGNGSISRADLIDKTYTAFFYPSSGAVGEATATYAAGPANQGEVVLARCNASNTPRFCKVTITGLNQEKYYARISSIYRQNQLTMTGEKANGDASIFVGAQAKIDVTGKAGDVTRRVQVHIPSAESSQLYNFPSHALISAESICKRLMVAPGKDAEVEASAASTASCRFD